MRAFDNVGFATRVLLGQSVTQYPNCTVFHEVVATIWLLIAFVLGQGYSCVLISMLTVPDVPATIESVEDLVRQDDIPWVFEAGSILFEIGKKSPAGSTMRHMFDGVAELNYKTCHGTRKDIKGGLYAQTCERLTIAKTLSDDFSETGECNFHVASKNLISTSFAMAFPVFS